jgi:hypothetical protein
MAGKQVSEVRRRPATSSSESKTNVKLSVDKDDFTIFKIQGKLNAYNLLILTKVFITYGDGNQEFSVDGDELIPLGPFKPFPNRFKT